MINGPAVGSGMDIALHCDIVLAASRRASLLSALGQIMRTAVLYLPKMVGLGRALEFAYSDHN